MIEPSDEASKAGRSPHSDVVTTRVNVAFPFSQIKVEEPSADLAAVAKLVAELTDLLVDVAPGPNAQALRKRAQALAAHLKY